MRISGVRLGLFVVFCVAASQSVNTAKPSCRSPKGIMEISPVTQTHSISKENNLLSAQLKVRFGCSLEDLNYFRAVRC
jgi:hypothetical protein